MTAFLSSKEKSSYLKGLAIIVVLINHYVNRYISNEYEGYANGIISIFFILSGYGLYFSMNKYNELNINTIKLFFHKRFIRIYPLYLLSLVSISIIESKRYSIYNYLAIPFIRASDIYWFVTFLLQCYLIAPLLFLILKKYGSHRTLIVVLFVMFLTHAASFMIGFYPENYVYHNMFLGHIFIFSLGYCLPALSKAYLHFVSNRLNLFLSFIVFILMITLTRFTHDSSIHNSSSFITLIFFLSSFYFVVCILENNIALPFSKAIGFIGNCSYSIYLFHLFYYLLLAKVGLIKSGNMMSIIITLALFPIFLLACYRIEKSVNSLLFKSANI